MKIGAEQVFLDVSADDAEELLRSVGHELVDRGLAQSTFVEALVARERQFPTGVETGTIAAALPHTDPEHVVVESLAFVRPAAPVEFHAMGDPTKTVRAQAIFFMLIADGKHQVAWLQALVAVLTDDALMARLLDHASPSAIAALLNERLAAQRV